LRFGESVNGWTAVQLSIGDRVIDLVASDLHPTVDQLFHVACFALEGDRGQQEAGFWLEPEGYLLRATRDGSGGSLRLTLLTTEDLNRPSARQVVIAEEVMLPRSVAAAVWRGLKARASSSTDGRWSGSEMATALLRLERELEHARADER